MTVTHDMEFQTGKTEADYTVPGLNRETGRKIARILQARLHDLNELHLTLKHAHWNLQGPNFIGVHEMLDPHIEVVRGYADEVAERIVTLGTAANGTPGALVAARDHDDYSVGLATTIQHLEALDAVYERVVAAYRESIEAVGEVDPVSEDILIGQATELEKFQWFIRAHLA